MKKNLELYIPILNIAGIFITLWLLTIINIKPNTPSVASNNIDTNRTKVSPSVYVHGFQFAHRPTRRTAKMVVNY